MPDCLDKRRRRDPVRLSRVVPIALLLTPAALAAAPPAKAPQVAEPTFPIAEIRVEGNTVLPGSAIENAIMPFVGPGKTRNDVANASTALEAEYSRRGFPTVSVGIPAQDARSGVIVLRVTQRSVGRLRVVGSKYHSLDEIKRGAPSLAEGNVPNFDDVQKQITQLNQLPDRTVTPVLKPGRDPDTVDVDLNVEDKLPLHGSIELNNRQQADTKPLRASASLSYGNLWQRGDQASVSFQLAPERPQQSEILAASYLFQIPETKLSLLVSYSHSDSNVRTLSSTLAALGRQDIVSARLRIPLWFEPGFTQTLDAGIDYKNVKQTQNIGGTGSGPHLTYYPATIAYDASWTSDHESTDFNASFTAGTRGLGTGDGTTTANGFPETNIDANRYQANSNFIYLRGQLTHVRDLPYATQLYLRATGQITGDALIPQEQLSLGGFDSVRGYYETEALADIGGILQTEFRSPSFAGRFHTEYVNDARVHGFADVAAGTIRRPLAGQRNSTVLGSVGIGARVTIAEYIKAEVQNAITLSDGPNTKAGSDRVLFRLYGEF